MLPVTLRNHANTEIASVKYIDIPIFLRTGKEIEKSAIFLVKTRFLQITFLREIVLLVAVGRPKTQDLANGSFK